MDKWLGRVPLVPPAWEDMGDACRSILAQADRLADAIDEASAREPNAGLGRFLAPPGRFRKGIHHVLSCKFPPVEERIILDASRSEFAVCRAQRPLIVRDPKAALRAVARDMTGTGAYREIGVATSADPKGRFVVFPKVEHIEPQLDTLVAFLAASGETPRAFRAMVALAMITNCHPFRDGNGRTARIMFNALLSGHTRKQRSYVPLREIAHYSRGGFIIRLRQAELRGEWAPLARFLMLSCRFWLEQLAPDHSTLARRWDEAA